MPAVVLELRLRNDAQQAIEGLAKVHPEGPTPASAEPKIMRYDVPGMHVTSV
jgi:hypothetical protein